MESIVRHNDDRINELELAMVQENNPIECPLEHRFTPGLYSREIFMPEGTLLTSRTHNFEHQFVIMMGKVWVSIDGGEWVRYAAPYIGITQAGTRRILYIEENAIWITFHPNPDDEEDIEILEKRLVVHNNPLLNKLKII